jgi:hypothetical protein
MHNEAMERSSTTTLKAPHSLHTRVFPSGLIKQPEAITASKGYHVFITTNTPMDRIARGLEGNIGKYVGGGRVSPLEGSIHGKSFRDHSISPWCRKFPETVAVT